MHGKSFGVVDRRTQRQLRAASEPCNVVSSNRSQQRPQSGSVIVRRTMGPTRPNRMQPLNRSRQSLCHWHGNPAPRFVRRVSEIQPAATLVSRAVCVGRIDIATFVENVSGDDVNGPSAVWVSDSSARCRTFSARFGHIHLVATCCEDSGEIGWPKTQAPGASSLVTADRRRAAGRLLRWLALPESTANQVDTDTGSSRSRGILHTQYDGIRLHMVPSCSSPLHAPRRSVEGD